MMSNIIREPKRSGSRFKWPMTLRVHLILLMLIVMLPALVIVIYDAAEQQHLQADAQKDVLTLTRIAVKEHEAMIGETKQLLALLKKLPQIRDFNPDGCNLLMQELLVDNPHYANFGVIRPNGDVVCSGRRPAGKVNYADRNFFRDVLRSKQPSISEYVIGRIIKKPVQVVAVPLLDAQQQVHAVVYASLNLEWLNKIASVTGLPPGSAVTVIDRHGVILTRTPNPDNRWTGVDVAKYVPFVAKFIHSGEKESLTEDLGVDDAQRIFALATLGSNSDQYGYLLVGTPSEPLYAAIQMQLFSRLAIICTIFFVIMLLTWYLSDVLIMRRMGALIAATRGVRSGDLHTRAMILGDDEIAHLAGEFNQMAESLQKNNHQIQRLNRIHAVLSGINGAILRLRERDALLNEACRIAIEHGGLRFAWIGLDGTAAGEVHKAAWHGDGEAFLQGISLPPHPDATRHHSPCALAILNDRPEIHNDIEHEDDLSYWHEQVLAQGYRAMAAFPLHREGRLIGIISLYADETGFFGEQETDLFLELAADISLGLEYIDKDQRIAHLHYYDALTGLPNRRLCEDRLNQVIVRAHRHKRHIGVIVVNTTGFRRVVGVYGNHVADELLNMIAKHLLGHVRDGDTVARLEGDEFAIVICDMASMEDAIKFINTIITGIPSVMHCCGHDIYLSMRAGVAMYPGDGEEAETLLRNASLSSAVKKNSIRHQIHFYSHEAQQAAEERERLEQALRRALDSSNELELHYQPVVDIVTHRIVSLEALARWNSPELGAIPPARFIPVAEASGLILPFGDWALKTACRQIEAWRQQGINEIRVAVNVSFHQLREADFLERLDRVIGACSPQNLNQLAIELTESELMDNIELTIRQIEALKCRNIFAYIDDFGTGYSSLSYLQRLPVAVLKIDQSFIRGLGESDANAAIVRTIIALAQSLNLKTIAEGVETREQLGLLQQLGCDAVQGYLFCKPKPAPEITRLLEMGGYLAPEI